VEKVFKTVCFRAPGNQADRNVVDSVTASFKANYSLKEVFQRVATSSACLGE
jgi:hypothetical protein